MAANAPAARLVPDVDVDRPVFALAYYAGSVGGSFQRLDAVEAAGEHGQSSWEAVEPSHPRARDRDRRRWCRRLLGVQPERAIRSWRDRSHPLNGSSPTLRMSCSPRSGPRFREHGTRDVPGETEGDAGRTRVDPGGVARCARAAWAAQGRRLSRAGARGEGHAVPGDPVRLHRSVADLEGRRRREDHVRAGRPSR